MLRTTLADLPTPCLVLDLARLRRNLGRMAAAVRRHGVALRPHLKTAKSAEVARLALAGQPGGIAVSTLAEAEHFARQGIRDIQYAVGIAPDKLARVAAIQRLGARVTLVTDSPAVARAVCETGAALGARFQLMAEVDCGEGRSGVYPDDAALVEIARLADAAANADFAGVMTHAGHSYDCRSLAEVARVAEAERAAAVAAAEALRGRGIPCPAVSVGATPTALHAESLAGVTETRPGVYMFGDLFQAQIGSCTVDDLAVSVLTEVIGARPELGRVLVDAGALALSKDRSTAGLPRDAGFGLVADLDGRPLDPAATVARVYQEHGQLPLPEGADPDAFALGTRLRIYPNHVCMTAAMYDRYHVVDTDADDPHHVIATWPRINGW